MDKSVLYRHYSEKRHEYAKGGFYSNCNLPSPPYSGDENDENSEDEIVKRDQIRGKGILQGAGNIKGNGGSLSTNFTYWNEEKCARSYDASKQIENVKPFLPKKNPGKNHILNVHGFFGKMTQNKLNSTAGNPGLNPFIQRSRTSPCLSPKKPGLKPVIQRPSTNPNMQAPCLSPPKKANLNPFIKKASIFSALKKAQYANIYKDKSRIENEISPSKVRRRYVKKKCNVKCNMCDHFVKPDDLTHHLFFGSMKCKSCNLMINNCLEFMSLKFNSLECEEDCSHETFVWVDDPVININKWLKSETTENSEKLFRKYLYSLNSLEKETPWRFAIKNCKIYLKAINLNEKQKKKNPLLICNQIQDANDCELALPLPKKSRDKLGGGGEEEEPVVDIINLPRDGNYLVVKEAIEECPNCYTQLCVENFICSVMTGLIHTICKECCLNIYFVLSPPDGSEPRIKILQS